MRQNVWNRFEVIIASALIAAHANSTEAGFRQRDVKFLIELFLNWFENATVFHPFTIENTQIQRYIKELVSDGFARQINREKQPRYRLTRVGLVELCSRLTSPDERLPQSQLIFVVYFLKNYGPRVSKAIENEGKTFPSSLRIEIEAALDFRRVVKEELHLLSLDIRKLEERVKDSLQSTKMAQGLFSVGKEVPEVSKEVEKRFPYGLNSLKPLSKLLAEVPESLARWELESGADKRAQDFWQPSLEILKAYKKQLEKILP